MLPESYLVESQRMLTHYIGAKLAANFSTQSAYQQEQIIGWISHHVKVVNRESERAALYITQVGAGANARATALATLRTECLALVVEAEAALA